ncbi:Pimeloyl-ACP methyl ester carboxylesterase [Halopenitus malekzadehii]|uniref:Pimeloyl-ACP methyl ester carboxylesterase n=1 Tax=Halopenitus malekzadehii TaxID=1267564 RepID=A0A1H6HX93_9EURY|nr:alpha/beta fold hydrolase [Halopenitus malekzadehii]SEH38787.1 Pimeloyl-ACP methyl ester carboxylesterase [Halopenitus malekzadehii]
MNRTRLLGGLTLGAGALAAWTRRSQLEADALAPALDGTQETYRWRGIDVAYTVAGDPDAPPVVLVHGANAAGSSGEWRAIFEDLAEDYRVIAPDLPGFGRSDRPALRYSAALYTDFLREFLAAFDRPRVIASSLSAAYVADVAADSDGDLRSLLLVVPTTVAGPDPPKPWLRELLRSPILGETLFRLIASKPSIRYFNADHGYYSPDAVADEWIDYEWRTAHVAGARFAPASFLSGHLNADVSLADALTAADVPVSLVWGRETELTPLSAGRDLATTAECPLVVFDRAKLLPHVEHPDAFLDVVADHLV